MLLKYLVLVLVLFATCLLAKEKEGENIVISQDALIVSSGGKKGESSNIVIKDGKKCTCCHLEHVEHWDAWIPQHNSWLPQHNSWGGWNHKKNHDHWKK